MTKSNIIRIPIDKAFLSQCDISILPNLEVATPDIPAPTPSDFEDDNAASLPSFSTSTTEINVPGFTSPRFKYPVISVDTTFSDSEEPGVRSWFAINPPTPTVSPSDSFIKRFSANIFAELDRLYATAQRNRQMLLPLRVGIALRRADGSHIYDSALIQSVIVNSQSPVIALREVEISGNIISTFCEVCMPGYEINLSVHPYSPPSLYADATHIDIFTTLPYNMRAGNELILGVRTTTLPDAEVVRALIYSRREQDLVRDHVDNDTNFRIVKSIPIADISSGLSSLIIPPLASTFDDWKDLPKLSSAGTSGQPTNPSDSYDNDDPYDLSSPYHETRKVSLTTPPLSLGKTDQLKRPIAAAVHGVFNRNINSMLMSLQASDHRSDWHNIASVRGPVIRRLHGVRARWVRLGCDITLLPGHFIDAISFEVKQD